MKSAKEWADDIAADSSETKYRVFADFIRAIQADAIKACAEKAFGVGRAMADGYKDTSCPHCNDGQVAAGNTGALTRENILSLLPKD